MAKSKLEKAISEAANQFALEIIEAVKGSTLQELLALQGAEAPKKRGRKPGRPPKAETDEEAPKKRGRKPGRPAKKAKVTKKRKKRNYPKCAFPECPNNRFPRGKGFCGEHAKMYEAGEIESAEYYKEQQ